MQNFYAPTDAFTDSAVILTGDDYFHATRSCRVRPGEVIAVTDGLGKRVEARITAIDAQSLTAETVQDISGAGELDTPLTLALALIKPSNFELALEKCTELGIRRIIPLVTMHTNQQPEKMKRERIEKILLAAAKQSGRSYFPVLEDPLPLLDLFDHCEGGIVVAAKQAEQDMEKALKTVSGKDNITIVIGPEGDFSQEEYDVLITAGASPVTLGGLTLRSETAAITAVSLCASCGSKSWKERLFG